MEHMDDLRARVDTLEHQTATLTRQTHLAARRLHRWRGLACGLLAVSLCRLALPWSMAQEERPAEGARRLEQRLTILEEKVKHVTIQTGEDGLLELVLTGVNLRIVNGLGSTATTNGLGNLLVGYNEPRQGFANIRTGSHNVVVGKSHNFSRFGGLVVGFFNTISGDFASVSGGAINTASGESTAVSGGQNNTASGLRAAVSGGVGNVANGYVAAVSGGATNLTPGDGASVSGGMNNGAFGGFTSVCGGEGNSAKGFAAAVSGGQHNTASGPHAAVSGGRHRTAAGAFDWGAGPLFADF